MLTKNVKNLDPISRFRYWIIERHKIYLKKEAGEKKPWTDDTILQNYRFTNPYRENDKTTVWFRDNIRGPMKDDVKVVFATICFRWFNLIRTGEVLKDTGLLEDWDTLHARTILKKLNGSGPIFTGAYMIQSPGGKTKLESITYRIGKVWEDRHRLTRAARQWKTLQQAHIDLLGYDGLGGFMAYEIVTDLRHTIALRAATDKMDWSNPGPGCIRGLYWMEGAPPPGKNNSSSPPRPKNWHSNMKDLLEISNDFLLEENMPQFEMHEVEMVLCEFDKYNRLLFETGRSKRLYQGAIG